MTMQRWGFKPALKPVTDEGGMPDEEYQELLRQRGLVPPADAPPPEPVPWEGETPTEAPTPWGMPKPPAAPPLTIPVPSGPKYVDIMKDEQDKALKALSDAQAELRSKRSMLGIDPLVFQQQAQGIGNPLGGAVEGLSIAGAQLGGGAMWSRQAGEIPQDLGGYIRPFNANPQVAAKSAEDLAQENVRQRELVAAMEGMTYQEKVTYYQQAATPEERFLIESLIPGIGFMPVPPIGKGVQVAARLGKALAPKVVRGVEQGAEALARGVEAARPALGVLAEESGAVGKGARGAGGVTKATQYSIDKVDQAIKIIEELAPQEVIRESAARRKQLVNAYESLDLHASKLGIIRPKLGTFYHPEEYLKNAQQMQAKVQETYKKPAIPTGQLFDVPAGEAAVSAREVEILNHEKAAEGVYAGGRGAEGTFVVTERGENVPELIKLADEGIIDFDPSNARKGFIIPGKNARDVNGNVAQTTRDIDIGQSRKATITSEAAKTAETAPDLATAKTNLAKLEADHAAFFKRVSDMPDKEYKPQAKALDKKDAAILEAIDDAKVAVMDAEDALKGRGAEAPAAPVKPEAPVAKVETPPGAGEPPKPPPEPPIKPPPVVENPDDILKQAATLLHSPETANWQQLAEEVRKKERGLRVQEYSTRLEKNIADGMKWQDAHDDALKAMSGEYGRPGRLMSDAMADQVRDAAMAKLGQVLKDEPFEQMSTKVALDNWIQTGSAPRTYGTKGGSAYARLSRILPKELLDSGKPLKQAIEDSLLNRPFSSNWVDFKHWNDKGAYQLAIEPFGLNMGGGRKGGLPHYESYGNKPVIQFPKHVQGKPLTETEKVIAMVDEAEMRRASFGGEVRQLTGQEKTDIVNRWNELKTERYNGKPLTDKEMADNLSIWWHFEREGPSTTDWASQPDFVPKKAQLGDVIAQQNKGYEGDITKQAQLDVNEPLTFKTIQEELTRPPSKNFPPHTTGQPTKPLSEMSEKEYVAIGGTAKPTRQKILDLALSIWNLPRTLMSSIDNSFPLRQGIMLSGEKAFYTSWKPMFKANLHESDFQTINNAMLKSPKFEIADKAGLKITPIEAGTRPIYREEFFAGGDLIEKAMKVPGLKILAWPFHSSQRGFTTFGNKLRWDAFFNHYDNWVSQGLTGSALNKRAQAWADFVNKASGKGNLGTGKVGEAITTVLNPIVFAPGFRVSRIQAPFSILQTKQPEVQKLVAKNLAIWLAEAGTTLGLIKLAGGEVETDPTSTEWGKGRIGTIHFDLFAGEQTLARTTAQFLSASRMTQTGKDVATTRGDILAGWVRSGLQPVAGEIWTQLAGKTAIGEKPTLGGELVSTMTPLWPRDLVQAFQSTGLIATPFVGAAFFGGNMSVYDTTSKRSIKTIRDSMSDKSETYTAIDGPTDSRKKARRESYRKKNPEFDSMLFLTGDSNSYMTPEARAEILIMVATYRIDPNEIQAVKNRQKEIAKREEEGKKISQGPADQKIDRFIKDLEANYKKYK